MVLTNGNVGGWGHFLGHGSVGEQKGGKKLGVWSHICKGVGRGGWGNLMVKGKFMREDAVLLNTIPQRQTSRRMRGSFFTRGREVRGHGV